MLILETLMTWMKMNSTNSWEVFHQKHIGASHIRDEKPCQDYSISSNGKKYAIAIVSDGHGSDKYFRSDRGARLACEVAMKTTKELMIECGQKKFREELKNNTQKHLTQLEQSILYHWNLKIEEDIQQDPFSPEELQLLANNNPNKAYGCTLIVTGIYFNEFFMGLHIGDGKCVVIYENGSMDQPIPWDDKCFLNITTSMCDTDALGNFRHTLLTEEKLPIAVFVGSDGIDDSFTNDENLHGFYQNVLQTFKEKGVEKAIEELNEYLPILSQKGSQDDISIAGILSLEK